MKAAICLLLVGCGGAPVVTTLSTTAPLVLDDVKSVELFLVDGATHNGEPLSCAALAGATPLTRADLVTRDHRLGSPRGVVIPDVSAASALILLVDGYASETANGDRIAHGCADAITVDAAHETAVSLVLRAISD